MQNDLPNRGGFGFEPIPYQRVTDKLESYMNRKDYAGAERHLRYWLQEAETGGDLQGQLLMCNELIGFFRKTEQSESAHEFADRALKLLEKPEFEHSVNVGTTCINIATAYNAFGEYEKSLPLFEKAKTVYESRTDVPPHLLGGLYNNMGLTFFALKRYDEAMSSYEKAIHEMGKVRNGALEQAITCLNMADTVAGRDGLLEGETEIYGLLDRASDLLHDSSVPHDGYYAFVCEKCAPSFSYYGYFAAAEEFQKEAEQFYERA